MSESQKLLARRLVTQARELMQTAVQLAREAALMAGPWAGLPPAPGSVVRVDGADTLVVEEGWSANPTRQRPLRLFTGHHVYPDSTGDTLSIARLGRERHGYRFTWNADASVWVLVVAAPPDNDESPWQAVAGAPAAEPRKRG